MMSWQRTLAERQEKFKNKRAPYKWGSKEYLASLEVGEIRKIDRKFDKRNLATIACYMKREFGCQFSFRTLNGENYVIRIF